MKFEAEFRELENSAITLINLCLSFLCGVYQRPLSYIVAVIVFVTTETSNFLSANLTGDFMSSLYLGAFQILHRCLSQNHVFCF